MKSIPPRYCEHCGARLPDSEADKWCPACLLAVGLEPDDSLFAEGDSTGSLLPDGGSSLPANFGRYTLTRLLGKGGMGTVYEATDRSNQRRVALKKLSHRLDNVEMRQRFLREGQLAAGIRHPNSLFIYRAEIIDDCPTIAMEIADGGTLQDRINRQGPMPVPEAVDAILDILAGLAAAHQNGVIHRDIKPSNCFYDPDGNWKLGDFGLSVSLHPENQSIPESDEEGLGTPAFASPEQLRGDRLDERSDLYSIGATLFCLLTGEAPFKGSHAIEVVARALKSDPVKIRKCRKDIPGGLARIIHRCLAKEAKYRPGDCAELVDALSVYSSRAQKGASLLNRISAGWIDGLVAFLPIYACLMFTVGADDLLVQPLIDRTPYAARYYAILIAIGLGYFTLAEGLRGAGIGKHLFRLRLVRQDGKPAGLQRAFIRIACLWLMVDGIRIPLLLSLIRADRWSGVDTFYYVATTAFAVSLPFLFSLRVRSAKIRTSFWDRLSGTRVVHRFRFSIQNTIKSRGTSGIRTSFETEERVGPFLVGRPQEHSRWLEGYDPDLQRRVWLVPTEEDPPIDRGPSFITRPGRLRWLQDVVHRNRKWQVFEAPAGRTLAEVIRKNGRIPWAEFRHWFQHIAAELWESLSTGTLPATLSLNQVWITESGRALLLDSNPFPANPDEQVFRGHIESQRRQFLLSLANLIEPETLPVHAQRLLDNLKSGRMEKLSFLCGNLNHLVSRPAQTRRWILATAQFLLPSYIWLAVIVGYFHDKPLEILKDSLVDISIWTLSAYALFQLGIALLFRTTPGLSIFRMILVGRDHRQAGRFTYFRRLFPIWLPVFLCLGLQLVSGAIARPGIVEILATPILIAWLGGAVYLATRPTPNALDRFTHTRIVYL